MKDYAFPRTAHESLHYQDLGADGTDPQHGLTLQQYYAAAALTGLLANPNNTQATAGDVIQDAVYYAKLLSHALPT